MGVATNTLILLVCFSGALIAPAWCQEGACLKDGRHKRAPSPEPHLKECSLYTESKFTLAEIESLNQRT